MANPTAIRAGQAFVELFADNRRLVRGLRTAERHVRDFGKRIQTIGMRAAGMTALFATPLALGAREFASFEQQMASVATMLDQPERWMTRFATAIRSMSVAFGESTETLAKGLYDILSASVPPEQALGVLTASAKAAKAGLTDTGVAADAITTVLNAYGLSADHAANVSDLLFGVVRRGKTTFAELAPAIGTAATVAATAGVGLDELGAAIATLTRSGIDTQNAMTAVNAVVSAFLKPAEGAAGLARRLGFEMNVATLKAKGLAGVLDSIAELDPGQIATLFPNIRAIKGILPALRNLAGFGDDIAALRGAAGSTEAAYAKMTDTLAFRVPRLKMAAVDAVRSVGAAIAAPLKTVTDAASRYLTVARHLLDVNAVIAKIAAVGVVAAAVAAGLLLIGGSAQVVAFALGGLATTVTAVLLPMRVGFAVISKVVRSGLSILPRLFAALVSPIGLVVASLVALTVAIVGVAKTGSTLSGMLGSVIGWVRDRVTNLAGSFAQLEADAAAVFEGIGNALVAGDIALAAKVLWTTLQLEWQRGIGALQTAWLDLTDFMLRTGTDAFYGLTKRMLEMLFGLTTLMREFENWRQQQINTTAEFLAKWWTADRPLDKGEITLDEWNRRVEYIEQQSADDRQRQERQYLDAKAAAEDDHAAALGLLADDYADAIDAITTSGTRKTAALTGDLDAAKKAWQDALAAAQRAHEGHERSGTGAGTNDPLAQFEAMFKTVADAIDAALHKATEGLSARGTFNPAAWLSLQGAGTTTAERTAKAAEQTAGHTKTIAANTKDLATPVFA